MSKRFSATEAKAITLKAQKEIEELKKIQDAVEAELDYLFDQISKAAQNGDFYIDRTICSCYNDIVTKIKSSLKDHGFEVEFLHDEDGGEPYFKISWELS